MDYDVIGVLYNLDIYIYFCKLTISIIFIAFMKDTKQGTIKRIRADWLIATLVP